MRFLSAWAELGTSPLLFILAVPVLLAIVAFLPGRGAARWTAAALSYCMLHLGGVGLEGFVRVGWVVLWALVAWRVGAPRPPRPASTPRVGGIESGTIGLLLAAGLLVLLVAAVARDDLEPDPARRASYGIALLVLGLLHLMLRRDALRAMLAFGSLGLGLQVLNGAARDVLIPGEPSEPRAILLAAAVALALADRLTRMRQRAVGSAWVSDAHDLHD